MSRQYRRFDDDPGGGRRSRVGLGVGAVILGTALGVGIGLLAAPETGTKTRRRLRQRISALGSELGEGLGGVQEFGDRARERVRSRLEQLRAREADLLDDLRGEEEEEESTVLGTVLAVAAGVAATYFLSSERAAPARARARDVATDFRRRAGDRWERFQHERTDANGQPFSSEESQDETTQATRTSGEAPRGS
jgi:gas vesicle protein